MVTKYKFLQRLAIATAPDRAEFPLDSRPEIEDPKILSDKDLVVLCIKNDREAWNEFFRRFIPIIKKAIKQTLRSRGRIELSQDPDTLWDVHKEIVINLFHRRKLRQCIDPSGIRAWLRQVAFNQTADWLRKRNSQKRLPEMMSGQSMLSLSTPLARNPELTLADTMVKEPTFEPDLRETVEHALEGLGAMNNPKAMWVLRLSIVSHLPLSEQEIEDLAGFNGSFPREVASRVSAIMADVEAKEERKARAAGQAVLLWHDIKRMESMLRGKEIALSGIDEVEVKRFRQRIQDKLDQKEECLEQGKALCRPSNRDIAGLVGVSEDQADQISKILARARDLLVKKMAAQ